MEDSSVTDVTLDIYREMRRDYDRVGAVIQSCLRRSKQDVIDLMAEGPTDIRLCKGIYIEPEDIAYTDYEENRNSFSEILDLLLEGGARVGAAVQGHGEAACIEHLADGGLDALFEGAHLVVHGDAQGLKGLAGGMSLAPAGGTSR